MENLIITYLFSAVLLLGILGSIALIDDGFDTKKEVVLLFLGCLFFPVVISVLIISGIATIVSGFIKLPWD